MAVSGRKCGAHQAEIRVQDAARGSASARGYGRKWRRESKQYLIENPLCVDCTAEQRVGAATEVDHVVPHRGDPLLFWNRRNWQPMCKPHHSAKTAREDGGLGNARREGGR